MNGNLPKTCEPTASAQKPKQLLDSTRPQSAATTKYGATTADVTRVIDFQINNFHFDRKKYLQDQQVT